jgi:hypothetical protein
VGFVQKLLEILLSMRGLLIHLFMLSNVLASFTLSSFSIFFPDMILGVVLGLCMDGHRLYTTNMEWSGRLHVVGWACHLQDLFCCLLLLVYLLLCFL